MKCPNSRARARTAAWARAHARSRARRPRSLTHSPVSHPAMNRKETKNQIKKGPGLGLYKTLCFNVFRLRTFPDTQKPWVQRKRNLWRNTLNTQHPAASGFHQLRMASITNIIRARARSRARRPRSLTHSPVSRPAVNRKETDHTHKHTTRIAPSCEHKRNTNIK